MTTTELAPPTDIRDHVIADVCTLIRRDIDKGESPECAAGRVLDYLRTERTYLLDTLLEREGVSWLLDTYNRHATDPAAPAVGRRRQRRSAKNIQRFLPGDIDTAEAIMECPYEVDGRWITVGDMDWRACRHVSEAYAAEANVSERRSRFFLKLATLLATRYAGATVAQEFNESELRGFLNVAQATAASR